MCVCVVVYFQSRTVCSEKRPGRLSHLIISRVKIEGRGSQPFYQQLCSLERIDAIDRPYTIMLLKNGLLEERKTYHMENCETSLASSLKLTCTVSSSRKTSLWFRSGVLQWVSSRYWALTKNKRTLWENIVAEAWRMYGRTEPRLQVCSVKQK